MTAHAETIEPGLTPGVLTPVTALASVLLAPNPGPMTLEGTNTWVIRSSPGAPAIVVDPGPADTAHLDRLVAHGPIALILVTHEHHDHTDGVNPLHERTGAPVRAASLEWCRGADPLRSGEEITVGGVSVAVWFTPGHTRDSVCVEVRNDYRLGTPDTPVSSICTGDTLLGRGTTLVPYPSGSLADYFASLNELRAFGDVPMLPGHGPVGDSLRSVCDRTLQHRLVRLEQVRNLLREWSCAADPERDDLVARILHALYASVPAGVVDPAKSTIRAQLAFLRDHGAAV